MVQFDRRRYCEYRKVGILNGKNTRVQNERNEPTFYARIPKMCIMDLDPYELALYCNYKQTASDDGYCDKSNTKLSKETGMSVGKVKLAKKSLEDKKLITVTHRTDKSGIENQTTYIKIIDVWEENHRRYAVEGGHVVTTPGHTVTTGGSLSNQGVVTKRPQRITSEEKPIKKNQDKKEKAPSGAALPLKPVKLVYPKRIKAYEAKHIEQFAQENPNILVLVRLDGMTKNITELTTGAGCDAIELFMELNRLKVASDRWQSLYTAGLKNTYAASIFRRMMWALERWLRSESQITMVDTVVAPPNTPEEIANGFKTYAESQASMLGKSRAS